MVVCLLWSGPPGTWSCVGHSYFHFVFKSARQVGFIFHLMSEGNHSPILCLFLFRLSEPQHLGRLEASVFCFALGFLLMESRPCVYTTIFLLKRYFSFVWQVWQVWSFSSVRRHHDLFSSVQEMNILPDFFLSFFFLVLYSYSPPLPHFHDSEENFWRSVLWSGLYQVVRSLCDSWG